MKIMLKEDSFHNFDATVKNVIYTIPGLADSDYIHGSSFYLFMII